MFDAGKTRMIELTYVEKKYDECKSFMDAGSKPLPPADNINFTEEETHETPIVQVSLHRRPQQHARDR